MARRKQVQRHPGEVLMEWIINNGHTQRWTAQELGVSLKHVNRIVRGRSLYSERLAIRLGEITDHDAHFWATLRSDWRLHEATQRVTAQPKKRSR